MPALRLSTLQRLLFPTSSSSSSSTHGSSSLPSSARHSTASRRRTSSASSIGLPLLASSSSAADDLPPHCHTSSSARTTRLPRLYAALAAFVFALVLLYAARESLELFAVREWALAREFLIGAPAEEGDRVLVGPGQFVMFGDSLTERAFEVGGMGDSLIASYKRKLDIVNRGFGGYNSAWALSIARQIFPALSLRSDIRLVTIWLGANDAAEPPNKQHVPLRSYLSNISHLITLLLALPQPLGPPEIILLTPPPVDGRWPDREPLVYANALRTLAEETEALVLDTEAVLKKALEERGKELQEVGVFLKDGLHFNPEGYDLIHTALLSLISTRLPHLAPDALPTYFPPWTEITTHGAEIVPFAAGAGPGDEKEGG